MVHNYDPTDLSLQDEAAANRNLKGRLERDSEESDVKWLMSSKRGRRIVWRLLSQAGVFQPVFHPTAMIMSFSEGKRNYGLQILTLVNTHCSDLYSTMVKENTHDRNADGSSAPNQ